MIPSFTRLQGYALTKSADSMKPDKECEAVVMSAEVPPEDESGGDIIRVSGMMVPDDIPLQAQHMRYAPDGSPTTIGKVVKAIDSQVDWKGKTVPAKIGFFKWADTDLARKYKALWPEFLNKVSIGARIKDGKPINEKEPFGGWYYSQTEVFELSVVTFAANPAAKVVRTICQALDIPEPQPILTKDVLDELVVKIKSELGNETKRIEELLNRRLDKIESHVVIRSPQDDGSASDRDSHQAQDFLAALQSALRNSKL